MLSIVFGMLSEVGRAMGVLDGVMIVEGVMRHSNEVNLRYPIVTNWDFATRLFSNCFEQDLLYNSIAPAL